MDEFTLSPILGKLDDSEISTKPFRLNEGRLEVEVDNAYVPAIECLDNFGYTGVFDDSGSEKPVGPTFVSEYLTALGIGTIVNQSIIGKQLPDETHSDGILYHYVKPESEGSSETPELDVDANYYCLVGENLYILRDETTKDYLGDTGTSISRRIQTINEAIEGPTGLLYVESQMEELNDFDIEQVTEPLTPTNHISDYVSLDHSVWYEGTSEQILLISLNNIYYKYNQLMYRDDAGIMEDPEDTDDERFVPIGDETHELKYGFCDRPDLYGRKATSGSIVELILKYNAYNHDYIQKLTLVVDPNFDGIPQRIKVARPGVTPVSLAFIIEVSTDCIVAYPNGADITDYVILDARVLI